MVSLSIFMVVVNCVTTIAPFRGQREIRVPLCELSQTVETLLNHLQPFLPTNTTWLPLARVDTGGCFGTFQIATDQGVEVLIFARFSGLPKQLVVYPGSAADGTVSVGHRSESPM